MENQKKSSKIETFLFSFTRFFAISGAIVGLIAIAVVIFSIQSDGESTHVALSDINTEYSSTNSNVAEAYAKSGKKVNIPENVNRHLSGDNEKILHGWLSSISTHEKKQDFLDNLSEVINDAESAKIDPINIINNYKTIKLIKLNKSEMEEYKDMGQKAAIYVVIFALIIFISLMSLILVMLAIERNTRHS